MIEAYLERAQDLLRRERDAQGIAGYSLEGDDALTGAELEAAALCYYRRGAHAIESDGAPQGWPLPIERWKPGTVERDLVRAGGLFLAEAARRARAGEPTAQADGMARDCARLLSLLLRDRDERM